MNEHLYIPTNIKTKMELFKGFGFAELFVTAIMLGISILISLLFYELTNDFYKSVLIVLISTATAFVAVRKNETWQSIMDIVILYFRFSNTQQKYKYEYRRRLL